MISRTSLFLFSAMAFGLLPLSPTFAEPSVQKDAAIQFTERSDFKPFFSDLGVDGTVAILDQRSQSAWVYNTKRADVGYIPASTFKIPHALFALDAGLVRDEFQIFPWDGTPKSLKIWERDHDLRSSMRNSVVWIYQDFARQLGESRERELLQKIGYGNADPSGGVERFWLDGGLRISAFEQIRFLERLYRNDLPFDLAHQRLVKDILTIEAKKSWILRAKTGWALRTESHLGWFVGWVEHPDGPVFFALNIDMPNQGKDAPKREGIARSILQHIEALPKEKP